MLEIPGWLREALLGQARDVHPQECCGLVARGDNAGGHFYRHTPVSNADPNPRTAYAFSEKDQVRIWDQMEAEGTMPWIIYHSHTETLAEPSGTDRKAAFFAGVHYVIMSTAAGTDDVEFRSYLCTEPGVLVSEDVVVT